MKLLMLSKWEDACSYYRMTSPAKFMNHLSDLEVRTDYLQQVPNKPETGIKPEDVEWADVVVFQRPITTHDASVIEQIRVKRPHKVLLGEYDDDYSTVPWWNPGYTFLRAKEKEWKSCLPHFDGVSTSTVNLAHSLKKVAKSQKCNPEFRVIKNAIDFEIFDAYEPVLEHTIQKPVLKEHTDKKGNPDVLISQESWGDVAQFKEFTKDKIVIAWFGSRTHFFDLDWVLEDLKEITQENKDVVVLFLGYINFRAILDIDYDQIFITQGTTPTSRYYHLLQTLPIDISLCPVDPNEFNQSKSAIKYLESCAAGFVPVCSAFDTYEVDFHKGFLADYQKGSWKTKIDEAIKMVRNKEHIDLVNENKRYVRETCDIKLRIPEYVDFYQTMLERKLSAEGSIPK